MYNSLARLLLTAMLFIALSNTPTYAGEDDRKLVDRYLTSSAIEIRRKNYAAARKLLLSVLRRLNVTGRSNSAGALELRMNLGGIYAYEGNHLSALKIFREVRKQRQIILGVAHEHTRMVYQNEAATLLSLGKTEKAVELLENYASEQKSSTTESLENKIWAFEWARDIWQENGNWERSTHWATRLVALSSKIRDASDTRHLKFVLNASALQAKIGELIAAKELLETTIKSVIASEGSAEIIAKLRLNLAKLLWHEARPSLGIKQLRESIRMLADFEKMGSDSGLLTLNELAAQSADRGDLASAETLADKALELINEQPGVPQENPHFVRAYATLGTVFSARNEVEASLSALEFSFQHHASKINEIDDDFIEFGFRLLQAYFVLSKTDAAKEFSDKLAAQIRFSLDDPASSYLAMAQCVLERTAGNLKKALQLCEQAVRVLKETDKWRPRSLRAAYELCETRRISKKQSLALQGAAELAAELLNKDRVFEFREESIRIAQCGIHSLSDIDTNAITHQMEADHLFKIMQAAETSDEINKSARLASIRSLSDSNDRNEALKLEYLSSRKQRAEARLLALSLSSVNFIKENSQIKFGLQRELAKIASEMRDSEKTTSRKLPTFQPITSTVSIAEVQSRLSTNDSFVIFWSFEERSFALIITPTNAFIEGIVLGASSLKTLVDRVRPSAGSRLKPPKERATFLDGFDTDASFTLYKSLWTPIERRAQKGNRIYIVNSSAISGLSFPLLLTSELIRTTGGPDETRALPFLLKSAGPIIILPNASRLLNAPLRATAKPPTFVGIGDPVLQPCTASANALVADAISDAVDAGSLGCQLPVISDTRVELERVASLFPDGRKIVLTGLDGTERNFRQLSPSGDLRRASLIQFSTHGLAPGELQLFTDPMRLATKDHLGVPIVGDEVVNFALRYTEMTRQEAEKLRGSLMFNSYRRDVPDMRFTFPPGIVLSATQEMSADKSVDSANDGFLSSSEIAMLDLDTELVVLSACNTAAQETAMVNTIFSGLSRAFLAAGAHSVAVTQWAVASEATGELSLRFIEETKAQPEKGVADALRRAMIGALERAPDPHPFLWASFVLVGGDENPWRSN